MTVPPLSGEIAAAEQAFLEASVAVWREIDRLDTRPEGYHPTAMDVDLRKRERAAWEQYRDLLDGPSMEERCANSVAHGLRLGRWLGG